MASKELPKIYDTVFSSPGMNDNVKIDLRISRKNVLLVSRLLENGLSIEDQKKDEVFAQLPQQTIEELHGFKNELLKKAGLIEFSEKLKML